MANFPKRVIEGKSAPLTNEVWIDTNSNPPVLKVYANGQWVVVGESSSSDDDDSGSGSGGGGSSLDLERLERVANEISKTTYFGFNEIWVYPISDIDWIQDSDPVTGDKDTADYVIYTEDENGDYFYHYVTSDEKDFLETWTNISAGIRDYKKNPASHPVDMILAVKSDDTRYCEPFYLEDIYMFPQDGFLWAIDSQTVSNLYGDGFYDNLVPLNVTVTSTLLSSIPDTEGFVFLNPSYFDNLALNNENFILEQFVANAFDETSLYGYKIEDNDKYELYLVPLYLKDLGNSHFDCYTIYARKKSSEQ